jgi:hypothetical protein
MPAPVPILTAFGPPVNPSRLPVSVTAGGSGGGGGGGLTPNPIRPGINIAFGSNLGDDNPLWQLLEALGPTA